MSNNKNDISGEILAAISMALYDLQGEVHDVESNVLTIKRNTQEYLPWSAKNYSMLQIPNKK